jgi:hypothetical protein
LELPQPTSHNYGDNTIKRLFSVANINGKAMYVLNKDECLLLPGINAAISENLL